MGRPDTERREREERDLFADQAETKEESYPNLGPQANHLTSLPGKKLDVLIETYIANINPPANDSRGGVSGALPRRQSSNKHDQTFSKRQPRGSKWCAPSTSILQQPKQHKKNKKETTSTHSRSNNNNNTNNNPPILSNAARRTTGHHNSQFITFLLFEFIEQIGRMREFGGRNPCIVLWTVSFPSDKVV
jgi:hypothetical protein